MIIFDLDGTLADCEHRRHFVDVEKNENYFRYNGNDFRGWQDGKPKLDIRWKPDWKAFYEACNKDTPIQQVISIWNDQISLGRMSHHMIWSGRDECVRDKTTEWLDKHLLCFEPHQLKMRPKGNKEPDEVIKERWLDEYINDMGNQMAHDIEFVFADNPRVIRMWRRRGIFVFNCCQHDREF